MRDRSVRPHLGLLKVGDRQRLGAPAWRVLENLLRIGKGGLLDRSMAPRLVFGGTVVEHPVAEFGISDHGKIVAEDKANCYEQGNRSQEENP